MDEKKSETPSCDGLEKYLATSVVEQEKAHRKIWFIAFCIVSALLLCSIGLNAYQAYSANNFDLVLQDGDGQNNYNKDIRGDAVNDAGN